MEPSVTGPAHRRSGALLVRMWTEGTPSEDPQSSPRARIYALADAGETRLIGAAAGTDGIMLAIRLWIEAFAAGNDVSPAP